MLLKRYFSILAILVYMVSTTEFHQMLRLPLLMGHFVQHQQENNQLGFLEFLEMHYLHGNPKDADYQEDQKLPFKSHDDCAGLTVPVIIPADFSVKIENPAQQTQQIFIDYNPVFATTGIQTSIWQPPKFC